jgi:hypothetical protein
MSFAATDFDTSLLSDLHKDAYGFRPSPDTWTAWKQMSTEELNADIDYMIELLEQNSKEEERQEFLAVTAFEAYVKQTMSICNVNRATAIQYDMDAHDVMGDVGYYEYHWGLPYGYINQVQIVGR